MTYKKGQFITYVFREAVYVAEVLDECSSCKDVWCSKQVFPLGTLFTFDKIFNGNNVLSVTDEFPKEFMI